MDSITLNRLAFSPLLQDQTHKHMIGMHMTMTGNFDSEKAHVTE